MARGISGVGARLRASAAGKPNPAGIIAAIVSAGLTAKLMQDAYHGHKEQIDQDVIEHEASVDYQNIMFEKGHWSGFRTMDHWAVKLFGLKLLGPGGLFLTWNRWKIKTKGLINGVIATNIIPIGITLTALFAGMGTNYRRKTLDAFKRSGNFSWDAVKAADLPKQIAKVPGAVGKSTRWSLRSMFGHGNWRISLPILGVLGFGAYRFDRVWNHEQQHDFFDDRIVTMKHH